MILHGDYVFDAEKICAPMPDGDGSVICYFPKKESYRHYMFMGKAKLAKTYAIEQECLEMLRFQEQLDK